MVHRKVSSNRQIITELYTGIVFLSLNVNTVVVQYYVFACCLLEQWEQRQDIFFKPYIAK